MHFAILRSCFSDGDISDSVLEASIIVALPCTCNTRCGLLLLSSALPIIMSLTLGRDYYSCAAPEDPLRWLTIVKFLVVAEPLSLPETCC